jgi:hypothetical protein
MDVDRDGNLYVLESAVPEIRVFDRNGVLLRRIGRRGDGPGEFARAPRFGVKGDTVWAIESLTNRITLFDRSGTLISTGRTDGVRVFLPQGFGTVLPWTMRADGRFTGYMGRVTYPRDVEPTGVEPSDSIPVPMVLFDASGAVTDTIGWAGRPPPRMWRPPWEEESEFRTVDVGGRTFMAPRAPTTLPWWEAQADGYLAIEVPRPEAGADGLIEVIRIGLVGDTLWRRELTYDPVPYSDTDLDSIAARAARGDAGGGPVAGGPGAPPSPPSNLDVIARALRGSMAFPEFRMWLQSPWVASHGSIWLRKDMGTFASETTEWVLLEPDGNPVGRLELPSAVRVLWHEGNEFWAVEADDFGVPWAVKYRFEES